MASPQCAGAVAIPRPMVDPPQQINNNLMCIGCGKKGAEFHLINKCPIMISWINKSAATKSNSSKVDTIEQEPLNWTSLS